MSARNFSGAQFGAISEATSTGLYVGEASFDYKADKIDLKNHIGDTVGFTLSDDQIGVKISGAVISKTAGIIPNIASVIALGNMSGPTTTALSGKGLFSTPVSGAGVVVLSASLKRASADFETGDLDGIYHPSVSASSPVTVS